MHIDILTLFPSMFEGPLNDSIIKRAIEAGLISVTIHQIRDYASGKHRVTDDYPYGGGGGMVMKPEPIFAAVEAILADAGLPPEEAGEGAPPVILLTPQGRLFTQAVARELSRSPCLIMICGRYEGVDERVREHLVTDEISIGDYVLTGGELAAMVVVDTVSRLIPGVLGDPGATLDDSHTAGLLEYPHYTRPPVYRGWAVPEVLLSGHHAEITHWRRRQAIKRTRERRPELLESADLGPDDLAFLHELKE